jgi:hypothetical protein
MSLTWTKGRWGNGHVIVLPKDADVSFRTLRVHAEIATFFDGLEMMPPGLVQPHLVATRSAGRRPEL